MNYNTYSASRYWDSFVENIVNYLPKFLGAIVVLIISYLIAKAIAMAIEKILNKAKLNQWLVSVQGGTFIERVVPNPANFVAQVIYWLLFLLGISIAVSVLGIPVLVDFVEKFYAYLPNVLAAILIFLVAAAVSAGVASLVSRTLGETPTSKIVGSAAPVLVMVIAVFMILNQLKIAPEIVTITYAAILGSFALGMALAFGLGGRDVASKMLQDLYDNNKPGRRK